MPDATEEKKTAEQTDDEFLATARQRWDECVADEKPIRDEAAEDLRFVAGDQWLPALRAARLAKDRPVLTFNHMHTFVQQVSNEARQMRGEIKFVPAEDGDKDEAEIFEGIARHIQYNSRARVAYETAVDYSAAGGHGYYAFEPEYVDDKGWDQEVKVVPIFDPFSIYGVLIPACFGQAPQFAFQIEKYTRAEFKAEFPKSVVSSWPESQISDGGWITKNEVRVARYYWIEETPETITREVNGEKETRVVHHKKIKCCKINGVEKLPNTETEWPGTRIPIFAVLAKVIVLNGVPQIFSVVRHQRDPQQLLNAYRTREAEIIGKSPITPFMAAVGQIPSDPTLARQWEEAANGNVGVLQYNPTDVNGKAVPAPQRQTFEPPIAALSAAAAQQVDEMKATAGIYDASLGSKGNETSGLAIQKRQQQSGVTNMHILDNLERSLGESGPELAAVIPIYYDGARTVRIMGKDEQPKIVKINQQWGNKRYDIGKNAAKYDVITIMARSYSSKRMESYDMISQIVQAAPEQLAIVGDVMFKNSDMAGSEILAERYHKMLPPQLQEGDQQMPPQAQAEIAKAQQQVQAMNEYAKQIEGEKQKLEMEKQAKIVDNQFKMQTTILTLENARAIAEINAKAQNESERLKLQYDLDSKERVAAHEYAMQKDSQIADADTQAADQAHQAGMAERDHEQTLEQQDQAGAQAMMQQESAQAAQPSE